MDRGKSRAARMSGDTSSDKSQYFYHVEWINGRYFPIKGSASCFALAYAAYGFGCQTPEEAQHQADRLNAEFAAKVAEIRRDRN